MKRVNGKMTSASDIVGYVTSGLKGTLSLLEAGIAARDPRLSDRQKAERVVLHLLSAAAEGASIGVCAAGHDPKIRIGIQGAAGALGIITQVHKSYVYKGKLEKKEIVEIVTSALFMTTGLFKISVEHIDGFTSKPELWKGIFTSVDFIAGSYQLGLKVLEVRQQVAHPRPATDPSPWPDVASEPMEVAIPSPMEIAEELPEQAADHVLPEGVPERFYGDIVLQRHKCPITGKPIRYPDVVDRDADSLEKLFYEREAIRHWQPSFPGDKPPGWPRNLDFSHAIIIPCPALEMAIRDRLRVLKNSETLLRMRNRVHEREGDEHKR